MAWVLKNDQGTRDVSTPNVALPAFSNPLTPGSLIVVVESDTDDSAIGTPFDSAGNTYFDCGAGIVPFFLGVRSISIFYALNTFSTASNIVYVPNSGGALLAIDASEWTGNSSSNPVDVFASNPNATADSTGDDALTSTAAVTTVAGDLIIGGADDHDRTIVAAGTGFTALTYTGEMMAEYKAQPSVGSIAATWSGTLGDRYGAIIVAFKPPTVIGGGVAVGSEANDNPVVIVNRVVGY